MTLEKQLTDLAVDWGDLAVYDVYPRRLPDLYAGQPLLVSGRFTVPGEAAVKITGRQAGRAWADEQPVVLDAWSEGNDAMAPVWAKARVTDLMNALWIEDDPDAEEAVTRLGLEYGLVTRFTSFLAVEDAFLRGLANADGHDAGVLGLTGTGMGGGGTGEGTIGLGELGTVGYGGGGGTGVGYGMWSAMARPASSPPAEPMTRAFDSGMPLSDPLGAALGNEESRRTAVAERSMGYGAPAPTALRGRSAAVPMVRAGAAVIRGDLSREVIQRVIRSHMNEIRFCYEQQLAARPDLSGRVTVNFVISASGAVQAASVAGSTLSNPIAEGCMAQAVRRWSFPAVPDGGVIAVSYPFLFAPSEAGPPPPSVALPPLRPDEDVIDSLANPRR